MAVDSDAQPLQKPSARRAVGTPTADDSGVWDIPAADDDALLVKELLGSLPPDERLVFCLHCLDGYGYRELAEGLELPIGTIKTRVHAARRRLKALLHEREETE